MKTEASTTLSAADIRRLIKEELVRNGYTIPEGAKVEFKVERGGNDGHGGWTPASLISASITVIFPEPK